jgi:hypothetical protein
MACSEIAAHWDEFGTAHGDFWLAQMSVAHSCCLYATQVIGASLRLEPIPFPPRVLAVRLSDDPVPSAIRSRRPVDWKTEQLALTRRYAFGPKAYQPGITGALLAGHKTPEATS